VKKKLPGPRGNLIGGSLAGGIGQRELNGKELGKQEAKKKEEKQPVEKVWDNSAKSNRGEDGRKKPRGFSKKGKTRYIFWVTCQ